MAGPGDSPMTEPIEACELTPILPLLDIPSMSRVPIAQSPSSSSATAARWHVSSHVCAAAYPRSWVGSYVDAPPNRAALSPGARPSREETQRLVEDIAASQKTAQVQGEPEKGNLWIAAKCYRPKTGGSSPSRLLKSRNRRAATTLVCIHPSGLTKEIWEPTLNRLLDQLAGSSDMVDEVWCLDIVNAGDSGVMNAEHLGPAFDWTDVSRDTANFLLRHLPDYSTSSDNPYSSHLPTLPLPSPDLIHLQGSLSSYKHGNKPWRGRHIIQVGHSIGGATSAAACSFLPAGMVKGLILVDPTVQPLDLGSMSRIVPMAQGAVVRRDLWKSKQEALQGFAKNKGFFGRWHKEVLAAYVEHALHEIGDGKVTLKGRRGDEAVTFLDPNLRGTRGCWNRLRHLPPTLRVHVLLADPAESVVQSRGISASRLLNELAATRPTYQQLYGIHHMIPQEAPDVAAAMIAQCIKAWTGGPTAVL